MPGDMMLCNRIDLKAPPCRARRSVISLAAAIALCLQHSLRARAENHADYRSEDYLEDNRRIHVETQSALVEADLLPWLTARGNYTYDSISGATPTGAPPQLFPQHYLAEMRDIRRAGFLETAMRLGPQTFTPRLLTARRAIINPSASPELRLRLQPEKYHAESGLLAEF